MSGKKVSQLVLTEDLNRVDVKTVLEEALAECAEFDGVFIVARVSTKGFYAVRIYHAGLNRLERGGILEEAAAIVRTPES